MSAPPNPQAHPDFDEFREQQAISSQLQPQQPLPPLQVAPFDHPQPHMPLVYPVPVPICSYYPPAVDSYTQPKPKRKRKPSKKPNVPQSQPPSARPKPRQSAYALWVGNIPSNSPIDSLRTLFATKDIESIFMIPRSRCAFINYKSEEGVVAGIEAFNQRGGQIRTNKLVVKRRSKDQDASSPEQLTDSERSSQTSSPPLTDRYFVCKSLTVRDLQVSRENFLWSTQSHNEAMLNKAFGEGSNVYLIFSANRTGEFFGCAKMIEPIPPKEKTAPNMAAASAANTYSPVITVTPSSGDIPAGRIVHDVERASLFWEVLDSVSKPVEEESNWTAPFRIQWLGDQNRRVHFSETRHLRNSLNSGREVKVARDGTEIEPSVGRTIVDMFN